MAHQTAALLEEIDGYVCDGRQNVTYQWLSRKLSVASDVSKKCVVTTFVPRAFQ